MSDAPATGSLAAGSLAGGSLPGDPSESELVERILRVDHAGEHGAVRIYEG